MQWDELEELVLIFRVVFEDLQTFIVNNVQFRLEFPLVQPLPYLLVGRLDGETSVGFHGFRKDFVGFIDVGGHDIFKPAT